MRSAFNGRIVFGASAIIFGIVSLIWQQSDLWQRLHGWKLAFAPAVAWIVALALIAGGAAMLMPRTARAGSGIVGSVFALLTLACISDIVAAPTSFGSYVDFFELLSIACGAFVIYNARAARIVFGVCVISFAWAQVAFLHYTASLVPSWIPLGGVFWTNLTTLAFALAALAILIDRKAALAMRLMAAMVALFGVLVWIPKIAAHPDGFSNWIEITENYLIAAASWIIADTV